MGAKASTANGEAPNARERTFSTSSGSEMGGTSGFNILRGLGTSERARSFSSSDGREISAGAEQTFDLSESLETDSSSTEEHLDSPLAASQPRFYTAHSHIFSWNGLQYHSSDIRIKCPVCSKFVLPDDIECHLVMCLTKPRLNYNEDVLSEDKGECVICLEELTQGDTIARLPCLCIYHKRLVRQSQDPTVASTRHSSQHLELKPPPPLPLNKSVNAENRNF